MKILKKIILSFSLLTLPIAALNAAPVTVFSDDGSGFNPNTSIANNWISNPMWSIGSTVQDIANNPAFSGTQGAIDMINTLGSTNKVISADLNNSNFTQLNFAPLSFTSAGGRDITLPFSQTANNNTASPNMNVLFDNFRMDVDDLAGGLDFWLWMDMYVILEVIEGEEFWITHEDFKEDGTIFNEFTFHTGVLTPGIAFINVGPIHAHATFLDGEDIGIRSDALVRVIPSPPTAWLIALGFVGLLRSIRRNS